MTIATAPTRTPTTTPPKEATGKAHRGGTRPRGEPITVEAWLEGEPPKAPPAMTRWEAVVRQLGTRRGTWADLGELRRSSAMAAFIRLHKHGAEATYRRSPAGTDHVRL